MKPILYFLSIASSLSLSAQSYNVALIPDSLKKDARAIVRENEFILEIKSPAKLTTKEHHVYTIFNERGDDLSEYVSHYDRFSVINSISGVLYDGMGKELRACQKRRIWKTLARSVKT